jgi:hypothetical protein
MCSLHPRLARATRLQLEELLPRLEQEVSSPTLTQLKAIKRKGVDSFRTLGNCAMAERLVRLFDSPTPVKRELVLRHAEDLIRQLGR